jgi:hypothetical protein
MAVGILFKLMILEKTPKTFRHSERSVTQRGNLHIRESMKNFYQLTKSTSFFLNIFHSPHAGGALTFQRKSKQNSLPELTYQPHNLLTPGAQAGQRTGPFWNGQMPIFESTGKSFGAFVFFFF